MMIRYHMLTMLIEKDGISDFTLFESKVNQLEKKLKPGVSWVLEFYF